MIRAVRSVRLEPAHAATPATTAAVIATLLAAAACGVAVARHMAGMDMGVATELGSFDVFLVVWVGMMAAMMLPGASSAVARHVRGHGIWTVPVFLGSYLAVWTIVGLAVYVAYRPHGTSTAAAVVIAAGVYELTPAKRHFRRRCRADSRSGLVFGLDCVGSSIGPMLSLFALGVMGLTLMSLAAVVIAAQKLLPARAAIDVPLGQAIVGFGVLIAVAPSSVPGLTAAGM